MRLTIIMTNGDTIDVASFDRASALDLAHELNHPQASEFLHFELDGTGTVLVARAHVVRIDIDD